MLTVILGFGELASQWPDLHPRLKYKIDQMVAAGDRAAMLTHQLLAFSRQQVIAPETLDVNAAVREAHAMLRRVIGEDVELTLALAPELGPVLVGRGQIEQIVMNLAVNSRDAMPGGGTITIETTETDLDAAYVERHPGVVAGRYVCLAVSDTGSGMDAETQRHIFEPFFTTKERGKGTGLGLSTVYGMVKQSGGHVAVHSEVGRGTSLKVYLPLVQPGPARAKSSVAPVRPVRGAETVLVVEDEDSVRAFVCAVLAGNGYVVIDVRRGEEAVEALRSRTEPVDLVVTDMVMPGMSGSSLTKRLAELGQTTPILYMSGFTDAAVVDQGVIGPDTPFLQKPFTAELLLRRVRETIDGPRSSS